MNGQLAVVVGGSGGIGSAIVDALLLQGTRVAVVARGAGEPRENLRYFSCDVTKPAQLAKTVVNIGDDMGRPSIMVHAAGRPAPGGLADTSFAAWRAGMEILLDSVFLACKQVLPEMARSGGGAVAIVGSAAGGRTVSDAITYAVAKGAIPHLVRCLAAEFAPARIRINCIAPGFIETPFHSASSALQQLEIAERRIPLRRFGTPREVAAMVLAILENRYLTGQTIVLDGGLNLGASLDRNGNSGSAEPSAQSGDGPVQN